jgi:hypothetical protein
MDLLLRSKCGGEISESYRCWFARVLLGVLNDMIDRLACLFLMAGLFKFLICFLKCRDWLCLKHYHFYEMKQEHLFSLLGQQELFSLYSYVLLKLKAFPTFFIALILLPLLSLKQ